MMLLKRKTVLATAICAAMFAGVSQAGVYADYCDSYSCTFDYQTDNVLDLSGMVLTLPDSSYGHSPFYIHNASSDDRPFIIKNVQLNDSSLTNYIYSDDIWDISYTSVNLMTDDYWSGVQGQQLILDGWNVQLNQQINGLFGLEVYVSQEGYADQSVVNITNSNIAANADAIFVMTNYSWVENIYLPVGSDVNMLSVSDSTIINTKQHVSDGGVVANQELASTHLGTILALGSLYNTITDAFNHGITLNFNFNNSYLEAESLVSIRYDDYYSPGDVSASRYAINLTNSNGVFKNLVTQAGEMMTEGNFFISGLDINLNNSVVNAAIYSEFNGGYRPTETVLNLTNNSVFNYLGSCVDTCNEYLVEENEASDIYMPRYYDSYIHQLNIMSNSTLAFSPEGDFKTLYVDNLTSDGSGNIVMNSNLSALQSDFLNVQQASGQFNVMLNDSGSETRSIAGTSGNLALILVGQGEANQFLLNQGNGVDIGAYVYDLKAAVNRGSYLWYLEQRTSGSGGGEPETSPSTDAVMSMASANQLILNDELQHLRTRRGDVIENNNGTGNVWGRLMGGQLNVNGPDNSKYKLNRTGMEFGTDRLFAMADDRLIVGVTLGLSDNRVKHARGGSSDVNAYSFGLYGTLLAHNNVYVDGTVKYTYFDNNLNAKMTNGEGVYGNYKQSGFGAALEAGYKHQFGNAFVEPYGRVSYGDIQGKSFTLSNGMQASLDNQKSLLGEVGLSTGVQFSAADNVKMTPYVKLAAEYEFVKDNDVYINDIHQFNNDFSGVAGKFGAGMNVVLSDRTSLFGEVNYANGRNIESPVNANVGVRVSF